MDGFVILSRINGDSVRANFPCALITNGRWKRLWELELDEGKFVSTILADCRDVYVIDGSMGSENTCYFGRGGG